MNPATGGTRGGALRTGTIPLVDDAAGQGGAPCQFILGAMDPEMGLIREVLDFASMPWRHAMRGGKRVYPGNAYAADAPDLDPARHATVYAVECGWRDEPGDVRHIDHHHPGDPGYGQPPARYFQAASIGQVFAVLGDTLAQAGRPGDLARLRERYTRDAHLAAAADHCLGAAYRGQCPSIDPDVLLDWCVQRRAHFLGRTPAAVMTDVENSCRVIRTLAVDGLADLRGLPHGTLPEAPHAACRTGIAALTRVTVRDGRHKIGLLGATPEQVGAFLSGRLVPGLVDCYGDPARGFAGGYMPSRA